MLRTRWVGRAARFVSPHSSPQGHQPATRTGSRRGSPGSVTRTASPRPGSRDTAGLAERDALELLRVAPLLEGLEELDRAGAVRAGEEAVRVPEVALVVVVARGAG